ncbi:quaternary ammonium transporter [Moraxella bovoculi]|uniref:Quaternary ammonium transporter n=1 Tax=Moraxella bovoculi TaxID=386891 RepID=A0AAC8PVK8_9GAMM|nr:SMR family transporter [Moraxella bovoculi]AKG07631.1 quaternary ammonium transporter [Moraxella bovoculi]AKG09767.1 quaternary ammonium transporter [Moraxella bovoculi]AKG11685.1 quaternary ammonium transporter [Moraxella bovoculi]AKG13651.1 quaternary ammonium transporter [Moraxella bovoculi]
MQLSTAYALLALAIISEVTGSTFLAKSDGFGKLIPTSITLVCFAIAFYLLSHVVKVIPLGMTYAIWSGVGIVLTALIGMFVLKQHLDIPAMIGIGFIIVGVIIMNIFSSSAAH